MDIGAGVRLDAKSSRREMDPERVVRAFEGLQDAIAAAVDPAPSTSRAGGLETRDVVAALGAYDSALRDQQRRARRGEKRTFPYRQDASRDETPDKPEPDTLDDREVQELWRELAAVIADRPYTRDEAARVIAMVATTAAWISGVDARESRALGVEDAREHVDALVTGIRLILDGIDGADRTGGADGVDGTDGTTDGTVGTDKADGADGTDGAVEIDEADGTDGTDETDETDADAPAATEGEWDALRTVIERADMWLVSRGMPTIVQSRDEWRENTGVIGTIVRKFWGL